MKRFASIFAAVAVIGISANAMVVTGVSVNGVRLVSEQEYAGYLPLDIRIAGRLGQPVIFDFSLVSDGTQNPNEAFLGDSLGITFSADSLSSLAAPANYQSITFYDGTTPQIPTSLSFSRTFTAEGIFSGALSLKMSNSTADYFSFFTGYEVNPTFRFVLVNEAPLSPLSQAPVAPTLLGSGAPPPFAGTPEPGTMGMAFVGGLAVLVQSRRRSA